jgi:hypothetical protein
LIYSVLISISGNPLPASEQHYCKVQGNTVNHSSPKWFTL